MPQIIEELHRLDRYSWVVTAYIVASITMTPIIGKLSDQFGRKWFLLAGTPLFLLGSALAGASQSMNQLIIFRGVQGLGSGVGMALIATAAKSAGWIGVALSRPLRYDEQMWMRHARRSAPTLRPTCCSRPQKGTSARPP